MKLKSLYQKWQTVNEFNHSANLSAFSNSSTIELNWKPVDIPNSFRGSCPKCGMGFTYMNGSIVSDPKFTKKS